MAVTGRLQPGVVGVPVDFLFQGIEDAHPRVRDYGGAGERHCLSRIRMRRLKKLPGEKFKYKTDLVLDPEIHGMSRFAGTEKRETDPGRAPSVRL